MKNLFVLHTQYNLLLATGLCKTEYINDCNDLILFKDFMVTSNLKSSIENVFRKVFFLEGNYPKKELSFKEKLDKIDSDNKLISDYIQEKYDRVFIVLDMCIQEMFTMKCAFRENSKTTYCWLEDGATAYYRNGVKSGGMGETSYKRFIRKMFFSLRYMLGGFYDLKMDPGMHKKISKLYTIYPEYVLDVYKAKERINIPDISFSAGMHFLYANDPIVFPENSIIIAMDLISNYGNSRDQINTKIQNYIAVQNVNTEKIFVKYHPRETQKLPCLQGFQELDRTYGLEGYLTNSCTKQITIIGVMSTALLTAKKMGYSAVSLTSDTKFYNEKLACFYNSIGVKTL